VWLNVTKLTKICSGLHIPSRWCWSQLSCVMTFSILSRVRGSMTNNNGFCIRWLDLLTPSLQSLLITITKAHNRWLPKIRSIPYWTTSFYCDWLGSELRIGRFYYEWLLSFTNESIQSQSQSHDESVLSLSLSLILQPTVSRPVSLGIKHPSGAYDQIFYYCQTVAGLLICSALSDERTGLSFTIIHGPRQGSHFRVRVP
jgi:hypothetical protein